MSASKNELNSLEISVHNDYIGAPNAVNDEEDEMEEGEASEDEVEVNVVINNPRTKKSFDVNDSSAMEKKVFQNFDDGIEAISDNTIDDKLDERAHRFGESSKLGYLSKENVQNLYKSLNLCEDDFNRGGWRREAITVKGIGQQKKQDIYDYFADFFPKYLERMNKEECNIVFKKSAAAALYSLSCPIEDKPKVQNSIKIKIENPIQNQLEVKTVNKTDENSESSDSSSSGSDSSSDSGSSSDSDDDDSSSSESSSSSSDDSSSSSEEEMEEGETYGPEAPPIESEAKTIENVAAASDIGVDVPSGGRWRLGVPFPGAKAVFMRFAHCKDSKALGLKNSIEIFHMDVKGKLKTSKAVPSWRDERIPREPQLYDRLGRIQSERPPRRPRIIPSQAQYYDDPNNYRDLDDPIDMSVNPWGFIAQNWTSKKTQQSLDYQALLRDHVYSDKNSNKHSRKRMMVEYEDDVLEEPRPRKYLRASYNYSEESDASDKDVGWNNIIKIPMMNMYADYEDKARLKRSKQERHRRRPKIDHRSVMARSPMEKRFDLRQKLTRRRH